MKTISVVIPTYNRSNLLSRAIDSVINQTYDDFELIIVDDASTDNTRDIVNDYDDDRIRYIRHNINKGGGAARNTGISSTNGEYIAFLDSDDEWKPKKLEKQISHLTKISNDYVGTYCGVEDRWESNNKLSNIFGGSRDKKSRSGGDELIREILLKNLDIGGSSTLLIKKQAITQINGFDPYLQRYQDFDFLMRLLKIGKIKYFEEKLVVKYRTSKPNPEIIESSTKVFLDKFSDEVSSAENDGYDVLTRYYFPLSNYYLKSGNLEKSIQYLKRCNIQSVSKRDYVRVVYSLLYGLGIK